MIAKSYTVFDKKAGAFLQPFFIQNEGLAVRAILDVMADKEHSFYRYAEDYQLFEIGHFDDQKGVFEGLNDPMPVVGLLELKVKIDG